MQGDNSSHSNPSVGHHIWQQRNDAVILIKLQDNSHVRVFGMARPLICWFYVPPVVFYTSQAYTCNTEFGILPFKHIINEIDCLILYDSDLITLILK